MLKKLKNFLIVFLVSILSVNSVVFAQSEPEISANAAILVEESTNTIIYEKNAFDKMYPASLTKLITGIITLEYFDENEFITVGSEINDVPWDSSKAGHIKGETLTVKNLLRGLLIPSGNDSGVVLASAVAKRYNNTTIMQNSAAIDVFTELMNEKAKELGCENTNFVNPHGYSDENHYTTAYDMYLITKEALKYDTLVEIFTEKEYSGDGAENLLSGDENFTTQQYNWKSHNLLITDNIYKYEYATGIKTGFTNEAGYCLAASAEKDGIKLIAIILDSEEPNRWIDAKNLFEYAFNNFKFQDIDKEGKTVASVNLSKHNRNKGDTLDVITKGSVNTYISSDKINSIERIINYYPEFIDENSEEIKLKAPIKKDEVIGTLTYMDNGREIGSVEIAASRDVKKSNIFNIITFNVSNFFKNIVSLKKILIILAIVIIIVIIILLIIKKKKSNRKRYRYTNYRFK